MQHDGEQTVSKDEEIEVKLRDANEPKEKIEHDPLYLRRKKYALLFSYSGANYYGLQWNGDIPTIEKELIKALKQAKLIPESVDHPSKLDFQRCARTDKGVSAAGNLISLLINNEQEDIPKRINECLPEDMRVIDAIRCTQRFNSKNFCSARSYSYLMPSFVFAPIEEKIDASYRLPEERRSEANELFKRYVGEFWPVKYSRFILLSGTHNFHNFTKDVAAWQSQSRRYIMHCQCSELFEQEGMQFLELRVKGQSFMMHQIRKMVGLVIAVMRGVISPEAWTKAFGAFMLNVPKAPALGLMLQSVHMDRYNDRFGNDGVHKALLWDEYEEAIESFKREKIYPQMIEGEKKGSMIEWLADLGMHQYNIREISLDKRLRKNKLGEARKVGKGEEEVEGEKRDEEELPRTAEEESGGEEKRIKIEF